MGYVGDKEIVPLLVSGLRRLEYRGYDSAGVCVNSGQKLEIVKKKGRIAELDDDYRLKGLKGEIGIAHTRWATHGEPSEVNAHPHLSEDGNIAIVHNGIIENHLALKEILEQEGIEMKSATDSEVLAHLIRKFYSGDLREAVVSALRLVEGAFGLVVMHKDEGRLIAARRGSPLILGVGNDEMFVASDVPAILNYTRKVVYLDDNEVADVNRYGYEVLKLNGDRVKKGEDEVKWTIDEVEKKGYKHFMLKEIMDQPEAIANTIRGRIKGGKVKLSLDIDINDFDRIVILACGTSWHSALVGKFMLEEIARVPVEVDYASEYRYRNPILSDRDLVIAISQSGETADTLAALREAQNRGAKTIGIVNAVGSTIAREVDSGIYLHAGPEISVASTKAYTCQIMALLLLSLYVKQERGGKLDEGLLKEIIRIPDLIARILDNAASVKEVAEKFSAAENFLYLGRGIDYPVAFEGAIKLKEISYIHAEGYPAAEMKHGPIALIEEGWPSVFIATRNRLLEKTLSNMEEVRARMGNIVAVVNESRDVGNLADAVITVPEVPEILSPLVNVIPLQLFAYYVADFKGLDVDKPRNLAKSVTVE